MKFSRIIELGFKSCSRYSIKHVYRRVPHLYADGINFMRLKNKSDVF